LKVLNLRTEYKVNPLGIGTSNPRVGWQLVSEHFNTIQTAYRIKGAFSEDDLSKDEKLQWDSGIIKSSQSVHVQYDGPALQSGERIYWNVTVWDNHENSFQSDEVSFFERGLLNPEDWKANWIEPDIKEDVKNSTPCSYLRKDFALTKKIKTAQLYVTCHGLYLLEINGQRINDHLFSPGWTSYKKRLQYQTYDVTQFIANGKNAVGAILGDGWYRGFLTWQGEKNLYGDKVSLLLQLKLTYTDGTEEYVLSDDTWKSTTGPIIKSDIYHGETYDARLEKNFIGWSTSSFRDTGWDGVIIKNFDNSILVPSDGVPVRIIETIKPISRIITPKGELVFDLGQNIVGWVKLRLKGVEGFSITLNHAEVLDKDGNFYTANLRTAKAEDTYIFKGIGIEEYEPHFTFHGFRYIKVTGYTGNITLDNICGRVIHSDMEPTGSFECSDPLVNRLQQNIQWSLRGNFLDVPTDCPQRDERLGWTGDAQVFASTACFNMDTHAFFTKWMKDFTVDQKPDGSVPWVVPMVIEGGGGTDWSDGYGATGWADAAIVIPWSVYQSFGDKRILENQYSSMKAWVDFMIQQAGDGYLFNTGFHFGDWLSFAEYYTYNFNAPDYGYAGAHTDKDLIATAYFYYSAGIMQKTADLLGQTEYANTLKTLRPKIKAAFQKEFVTATGRLTSNTQTAYVLALSFGIMPDDMREIAAKRLADDVNYFGHLTTGFLGTPLICDALTENGYPDIAYKLFFNKRYPSWLYPVTIGATTIWERWDGIKPDGTFQNEGMNSFNHYAFGAIGNWLYTKVAGLSIDPENPGYKKMIIKPYITNQWQYAKAELKSVYGKIISGWKIKDNVILMNITIPVNTTAKIVFPTANEKSISLNGSLILDDKNIKFVGFEKDSAVFEVGSGSYEFEIKN
jgi:alpha-L-rhamnosidase